MSEDSKKSLFNAGIAMTERIHHLQVALNAARFNPIAFNAEANRFNYEIMVSANDGLMYEVWSKLDDNEKKKVDRIKNLIHTFLDNNAIVGKINEEYSINKTNLKKFYVLIDLYEKTNKELLDEHNLNSPTMEDDDEY